MEGQYVATNTNKRHMSFDMEKQKVILKEHSKTDLCALDKDFEPFDFNNTEIFLMNLIEI